MKSGELLKKLALEVNSLLDDHIAVHNKRLKEAGSFWSLLRKVDFEKIWNDTVLLGSKFEAKKQELGQVKNDRYQDFNEKEKEFFDCLLKYFDALHKACALLSKLARTQYQRSKNEADLSLKENMQLENAYKGSQQNYLHYGKKLNTLYRELIAI